MVTYHECKINPSRWQKAEGGRHPQITQITQIKQKAVGRRQFAEGSRQKAVRGRQFAEGSSRKAVGRRQFAEGSSYLKVRVQSLARTLLPNCCCFCFLTTAFCCCCLLPTAFCLIGVICVICGCLLPCAQNLRILVSVIQNAELFFENGIFSPTSETNERVWLDPMS